MSSLATQTVAPHLRLSWNQRRFMVKRRRTTRAWEPAWAAAKVASSPTPTQEAAKPAATTPGAFVVDITGECLGCS